MHLRCFQKKHCLGSRIRVIKHIKIAFPHLNKVEVNALAKKHWFVFGQIIGLIWRGVLDGLK